MIQIARFATAILQGYGLHPANRPEPEWSGFGAQEDCASGMEALDSRLWQCWPGEARRRRPSSTALRLEDHDLRVGRQMRYRYEQAVELRRIQARLRHHGGVDRRLAAIHVAGPDRISLDVAHAGRYIDAPPPVIDGDSVGIAADGQPRERAAVRGIQYEERAVHRRLAAGDIEPAMRAVECDGEIATGSGRQLPSGDDAACVQIDHG